MSDIFIPKGQTYRNHRLVSKRLCERIKLRRTQTESQ